NELVDTILLVDSLKFVLYDNLDPVVSKVECLKSLTPLLAPGGKILVVTNHPSGKEPSTLGVMQEVRDRIRSDKKLNQSISFFGSESPNEIKTPQLLVLGE